MTMLILDNVHDYEYGNGYNNMTRPIVGLSGGLKILQFQWWNADPWFTMSAWAETQMAATAAACAGYDWVIWDIENEPGTFRTDSSTTSEPALSTNRDFVYSIIDELRSRLDPSIKLGYWALPPLRHFGALSHPEYTDAAFVGQSHYTNWIDADDNQLDDGFMDHFDAMFPYWYPQTRPIDWGAHANSCRRFVDEADRLKAITEKPAYFYTVLFAANNVSNPLSREEAMTWLKGWEKAGVDGLVMYGYYVSGQGNWQALRDFVRLNRQTIRMKTYCLIGDSQTSANSLSFELAKALHDADPTTHWREEPAKIVGASWTMADAVAGIDAALAAVTGYVDEVLVNLGGYDLASMPDETSYKADLVYFLEAIHAKWGTANIRVAYPWQPTYDTEAGTLGGWNDDVQAIRATTTLDTLVGIDIQTAIEGKTSGVNPTAAGTAAIAAAWAALLTA